MSLATAPGYSPKPAEGPVGDSESSLVREQPWQPRVWICPLHLSGTGEAVLAPERQNRCAFHSPEPLNGANSAQPGASLAH